MALRGCIRVDGLPLQILLRDNPSWTGMPVAVTKEEKPRSPILALNQEARGKGLAIGMKYANALAIAPGLRAREVHPDRVAAARERIVSTVHAFTPDVEPCPFDVDALWVSLEGLGSLFASETAWIREVRRALWSEGFKAHVVAGFTRFGTYAIARSRPRSLVFECARDEQAALGRAPVAILPLPQRVRSTLARLEVSTVGQFVSLPPGETMRRFGAEAGRLQMAISMDDPVPIQAAAVKETARCCRHLDAPLSDLDLLMPNIEELLQREAGRAEAERSVISGLTLVLRTEDGQQTTEEIRPAAPTLRIAVLGRLVQLRLSGRRFTSGVEDIEIRSSRTQPSRVQEELFTERSRDLEPGARAFAAIRARFGNHSVTFARTKDSHLPEGSTTWVPMRRPRCPSASRKEAVELPAVVRRVFFEPRRAAPPQSYAVMAGPFDLSGSWWEEAPYQRSYFYCNSPDGLLWLFVDRLTGMTWTQGLVD